MVPVTPYSNSDAIRGCLGVTDNELTDEMISDSQYGLEIELHLDGWLPNHDELYRAATAATAAVKSAEVTYQSAKADFSASESSLVALDAAVADATAAVSLAQQAADSNPGDSALQQNLHDANNSLQAAILERGLGANRRNAAQQTLAAAETDLVVARTVRKVASRSYGYLTLYCQWYGAVLGAGALLAIPKKQSNGKDVFERFTTNMAEQQARAAAKVVELRQALEESAGLVVTTVAPVLAAASNPAYDPMTNSGYTER